MTYDEVLTYFQVKKRQQDKAQCKCPAHDDRQASLTVTNGRDSVLIHCHAGCDIDNVLSAAGLEKSDLFYQEKRTGSSWQAYIENREKKRIEAVYNYVSSNGGYLFTKVRMQGKKMIYGTLANERFTYGLGGRTRKELCAVYAPDGVQAINKAVSEGKPIFIPEGEKDADTLSKQGYTAFSYGGVNDWSADMAQLCKGAVVYVLADNDEPGRRVANIIQSDLQGIAKSAKVIVPVPDIPKADISDYFAAGHSKEELESLLQQDGAVTESAGDNETVTDRELSYNEKGKIIQSIGNCVKAIHHDECLKEMFRYNEMTDKVEVSGAWWRQSSVNLSDNDVNNIRLYLETTYGLTHEKNIPRAIDIIAHQRSYHPIKEYLASLKWSGGKHIENLLPKYLGAEKSDYTTEATKITMLGAIERVHNPGAKFESMLCLVEDRQGGGKSTMARFIATRDEWFTDDVKNLDDENIYRKLQGHWIVEFSEMLVTANTKTVEAIKAFLSRQKDTYKVPYDKYPHDFPRQCIFIGTTNNLDFLPNDKTGNRRFIPVRVNSELAEVHPLEDEAETRAYIDQAWAEAMEIYRSGDYKLTFPKELQGLLSEVQQEFTPEDPKAGIIQEWLDNCQYDSVCSRMLYKEALGKEFQEPKEWELREINGIMNKSVTGWRRHPTSDSKVRFEVYGKQRAWDRVDEHGFRQRVPESEVPEDFAQLDMADMKGELPFD